MKRLLLALTALPLAGCVASQSAEMRGQFETLLAGRDSATSALQEWCARRGFADPAVVTAEPAGGPPVAASAASRAALEVSPDEPLGYRHVRLTCGGHVLSQAQNWYVPARLTPAMNRTLETTRTAFGTVVSPLGFARERLDGRRGASAECPPGTILSHRALLRVPGTGPISLVVECYTADNLE